MYINSRHLRSHLNYCTENGIFFPVQVWKLGSNIAYRFPMCRIALDTFRQTNILLMLSSQL